VTNTEVTTITVCTLPYLKQSYCDAMNCPLEQGGSLKAASKSDKRRTKLLIKNWSTVRVWLQYFYYLYMTISRAMNGS